MWKKHTTKRQIIELKTESHFAQSILPIYRIIESMSIPYKSTPKIDPSSTFPTFTQLSSSYIVRVVKYHDYYAIQAGL